MPSRSPETLPAAARRLLSASGAGEAPACARVELAQSGVLRASDTGRWMRFSARQAIRLDRSGFDWTARIGPLGLLRVRDALADGVPAGGVSLLGLIPLASAGNSPELGRAQLMRYLAELPWAPDAILANPDLRWREADDGRLHVAAGAEEAAAEVAFTLGSNGLVERVEGFRPRQEGKLFRDRPWHGAFSDYRPAAGRMVPFAGEVGWTVDGRTFPVWRGKLSAWSIAAAER